MKKNLLTALLLGTLGGVYAQKQQVGDSLPQISLEEVKVNGLRTNAKQPMPFTNVDKNELAERNLGQDIPILLNFLPSVVTTSDAGAGVGYTGIRVRGSDATRVNVTINGIPYNDAESQGTFWVNLPDFASSVESIQLQRGVGTSTNGPGAFGASLNLLTDALRSEGYANWAVSGGSFNTLRNTLKFSTGLLNDHFELSGRLSKITSDGYVDRAASNLKSYFLQGAFKDNNTLIKALAFGGHEITYQSWYGIDKATLAENRTYNPAGSIYDDSGSLMGYYDRQEDNYRQDHYQFHWTQQLEANWNLSLGLNYTYGRGYYEEYNDLWDDQNLSFSGATEFSYLQLPNYTFGNTTISTSENVTRKWLDNDYYVGTLSVNHNSSKATLNFGLLASRYIGDHFGTLIWGEQLRNVSPRHRFYENVGRKNEASAFAKGTCDFNTQWSGYLDLQWRSLSYTVEGEVKGPAAFSVDERYSFFNPKAGVVFTPNAQQQLYFSFARAHREPNRTDFENGAPKPEQLNDFELGWRWNSSALQFQANAYYMAYKDQLVLTGALDEVGSPIRENVGKSRRYGIELEAKLPFASQWLWMPNLTWSRNENQDFFFQRDGNLQNLGNTKLSYSPEIIATNAVVYAPSTNIQLALLTKHVGEQYMGNIDAEKSLLAAYTVTDLNLRYVHNPEGQFFKQLEWSLLLNNLFNASYVSNGYFYTYDDTWSAPGTTTTIEGAGYYPQAGRNLLLGLSIQF